MTQQTKPRLGRPPIPAVDKPVAITVRVHPELASRFCSYCRASAVSQAKVFSLWIQRHCP
jgi:hypothetical protein